MCEGAQPLSKSPQAHQICECAQHTSKSHPKQSPQASPFCNSSSGPTCLKDICSGSTPARCHGIEAIERHEMPHNYPGSVHPLLDELHEVNVDRG